MIFSRTVGELAMRIPEQWRDYPCQDYFSSRLAVEGFWDEHAQLWLIEPAENLAEENEAEFLQVGRPGVDDIGFGYRKAQRGIWAFYRKGRDDFQFLAPTIQQFLLAWQGERSGDSR
jgi:hypothetical protein